MKKTIFIVLSISLLTILLGCGKSANGLSNELANTAWKSSYEEDYEYEDTYEVYDNYYGDYSRKTETKTIKVPVTEEWVFYKDSVQISVTKRKVNFDDYPSREDTATLSYSSSTDSNSYSYYVTNGSLYILSKSASYDYRIEGNKLYLTKMGSYNNDNDIVLTRDYSTDTTEEDESLLDKLLGWLPF